YIQLSNAIVKAIEDGFLAVNDSLPSLNQLSNELELAKDTVEKAYGILKKKKIIGSVSGKGYFVLDSVQQDLKILLLFNKLSAHKKIIYDSFVETLGDKAAISFYVYNNDFHLFRKILLQKIKDGGYSHYVIIPHFYNQEDKAIELINTLPKEKLVLMDKNIPEIVNPFASVYEDFENDIYFALQKINKKIDKYSTINIIFPEESQHHQDILNGVKKYCLQENIPLQILPSIEKKHIQTNSLFITLMEDDLVKLVEKTIDSQLKVGKDIGIISYNEVAIKKIILNGITTFSTNFEMMGKDAANAILNHSSVKKAIPFKVNVRDSI
ncbi:MAG: transcriptional regulator, partial [Pseudopedobacter saltans]